MVGKKGKSGRRPGPASGGRKQKQLMRFNPTNEKRSIVLQFYINSGRNMKSVRAKYYSDLSPEKWDNQRKRIYEWYKSKDKILAVKGPRLEQSRIRNYGNGTSLSKESERDLVFWIVELRSDGIPVPGHVIQKKALEIAAEKKISTQLFAASNSWLKGFLRRHRL